MSKRRVVAGLAVGALAVTGALAASGPATADLAPQANDVVSVGSDIQQNAFNFLADGYGQLPGYNTAGNKFRFVNFDSSGDAQGRSAYLDPSLLATKTVEGDKYVKLSDIKLLNPTISLLAGQPLEVRPSGGNGGLNALTYDGKNGVSKHWIDVARSPNVPTAAQQAAAEANLGTRLHTIQVGLDKDVIATAEVTNAPATLSGETVVKIYQGVYTKWGDIPGYAGSAATETIIPLIPPSSAGMLNVFLNGLKPFNGGNTVNPQNPNLRTVQQNDPVAITSLPEAERKNAIVPFPRGRFRLLNTGYYADPSKTNAYTQLTDRVALTAKGIKLLDNEGSWYVDFPYNAIFRESDVNSTTPWQPGSTLNWVRALFYNPGGESEPFVNTEAGKALLSAAGITPKYEDKGTE